jgi:hypothetical protein
VDKALAFSDELVAVWALALEAAVLGLQHGKHAPGGAAAGAAGEPVAGAEAGAGGAAAAAAEAVAAAEQVPPLGQQQLRELVDMLGDVQALRAHHLGGRHPAVADVHFVEALALAKVRGAAVEGGGGGGRRV